eukprot:2414800-Heterocapsa_arctica.AAC.1
MKCVPSSESYPKAADKSRISRAHRTPSSTSRANCVAKAALVAAGGGKAALVAAGVVGAGGAASV